MPSEHRRPGRKARNITYEPFRSYDVTPGPDQRPIVLYLRLSRYHADHADAIERQRLDLTRKLAADAGWVITGEYIDNDSASASAVRERKGWNLLNRDIRAGAVPAVAFWKLDRINRVAWRIMEWLGTCRQHGVTLVSHEDPASELNAASASSKLITGIKSLFAEIETDTMSTRQSASKRHLAEAGFSHGGPAPFGWQRGPRVVDDYGRTGITFQPHPVEHPALKAAVEMVIGGASLHDVSRHWRDVYGIVTADGAVIAVGNIRRYLTSPRLMGYRMRQVPKHRRGSRINLMDHVARDADGNLVVSQEPVCDRTAWLRLQDALSTRLPAPRGAWGANEWLLAGLLRCGSCGGRLFGQARRERSGTRTRRYVCLATLDFRPGTCPRTVSIVAEPAERFVLGWVAAYLSPERLTAYEDSHATVPEPQRRLIADLDEARTELRHLIAQQGSQRWRGSKVDLLLDMIADADDRVRKLEGQLHARDTAADLPGGDSLLARWPSLNLNQRRAILARVLDRVEVATGRGAPDARLTMHPRF